MPQRIEYAKLAPQGVHALRTLGRYLAECDIEPSLQELVRVRV
jgi:hypothetical protein